ncbi:MAG: hypothetical protein KDB01_24865, partial [Planctomycetaceae bacterium]|nr:hypothetical protein [Planctomycetaceae bacterium]
MNEDRALVVLRLLVVAHGEQLIGINELAVFHGQIPGPRKCHRAAEEDYASDVDVFQVVARESVDSTFHANVTG